MKGQNCADIMSGENETNENANDVAVSTGSSA